MEQDDLNKSHYKIWEKNPEISQSKEHTKLSIQFVIGVLEEIVKSYKEDIDQETRNLTEWGLGYRGCSLDTLDGLNYKIQELKQYYDSQI